MRNRWSGLLVLAILWIAARSPACDLKVSAPPAELNVDSFYQKYVSANGYPIVASGRVSDYALKEAAYLVNMMLAKRPDIREAMIKGGSRLIVMAYDEFTTDVPEHSAFRPKDYWDARARGLGGSRRDPVCSCAEENLLGYPGDPYAKECILIHEFAHNIHLRGVVNVDPTFDERLKRTYEQAMDRGLWASKYASVNHHEYWAEGVQSWFNNNRPPDHDHNHVNTRHELRDYDPGLAALCEEVFGDTELVYTKPVARLTGHLAGYDPDTAPTFRWPERLAEAREAILRDAQRRASKSESKPEPRSEDRKSEVRASVSVGPETRTDRQEGESESSDRRPALPAARAAAISLLLDDRIPQAAFAAAEIRQALLQQDNGVQPMGLAALDQPGGGMRIVLCRLADEAAVARLKSEGGLAPRALRAEGYSLRVTGGDGGRTYWVVGADEAGLMYGGLELAELIRVYGLEGVRDTDQNAYFAMRGVKFNIPLDARTPTYTDPCDAAQKNILEMWNLDFWKEYLDHLARYRYNFVSLWSLHPFPSMVRVPEYPDVALDDVKRSKVDWKETYSLNGIGFDAPEILGNLDSLKEMTIDEKIEFWRTVMQYAKDRNISFYVVTWNIFVNGTDGKYGITDKLDNAASVEYFRASVREMFRTYPLLAGIGLTTGENMPGAGFEAKENWAFETYGRGVLDAAGAQPGRKITLIHRQHQTGADDIARRFRPLIEHPDIRFLFSFKYAKAHVYSSTRQTFHQEFVRDIGDLKTIWTLRNDDVYHFRWGAPDFVREFLKNIPYKVSQGFYFGSDQYVWGREFLSTEPDTPRQLEIAKHWYHWMLWGRLGYDPDMSDQRFVQILQHRFPDIAADELFTAWQQASLIYPKTTGFHWGALDFQWYIEACKSQPGPAKTESGFHDVNRFITLPPHPGTDYVSIPDFVDDVVAGRESTGTTPMAVSDQIHGHADQALRILDAMSPGDNKELRLTLGDIRAIAYLGKYYAHKIRGATELALYRKTERKEHQDAAVDQLNDAADYWCRYVDTATKQYKNPLWTNRVGYCDWKKLTEEVKRDIRIAGGEEK